MTQPAQTFSAVSGRKILPADIEKIPGGVKIPRLFSLAETLDCGQAFRWEKVSPADTSCAESTLSPPTQCIAVQQSIISVWQGKAFGKNLTLTETDSSIILDCSPEEFSEIWLYYFDLDADYDIIRERLSCLHPLLREAACYAPGIRILRQEPWEALCSFIISQNNNIPRIKGIINRLCENFGENGAFPSAEILSELTPEDLAPIRSGFRAKYIAAAARTVSSDPAFIPSLFSLPVDEARKKLMTIKGVGPKVADCTLLFGFHRMDCFPVDTWMKKAMKTLLPDTDPAVFGCDAGIAQQYIFHYSRMHPELFE